MQILSPLFLKLPCTKWAILDYATFKYITKEEFFILSIVKFVTRLCHIKTDTNKHPNSDFPR